MIDINCRAEVLRAVSLGYFGNVPGMWYGLDEVPRDYRNRLLSLRQLQPGKPFLTDLAWSQIVQQHVPGRTVICEPVPHEDLLVQGEWQRAKGGYYFYGTHEKTYMRFALLKPGVFHWEGWESYWYLRGICSPESWGDLMEIFDEYPEAVIELTVFDHFLGRLPGRNTIVWEVRAY